MSCIQVCLPMYMEQSSKIMNPKNLETTLVNLIIDNKFEEAEKRKIEVIPWLEKSLELGSTEAQEVLLLFAQLAGEVELFENSIKIMDDFKGKNLISNERYSELLKECPANRWLD